MSLFLSQVAHLLLDRSTYHLLTCSQELCLCCHILNTLDELPQPCSAIFPTSSLFSVTQRAFHNGLRNPSKAWRILSVKFWAVCRTPSRHDLGSDTAGLDTFTGQFIYDSLWKLLLYTMLPILLKGTYVCWQHIWSQ